MASASPRKRLIIIGAGFAGINLARRLDGVPIDITLIDQHNYHLFQPLLYEVATAALSPADIAYPIRRICRYQKNVRVVLGTVERIDLEHRQVCGNGMCIEFDYLAVCIGATHSYFGKRDQWQKRAPGLKTVDDATDIRRRMLLAFEEAELEEADEARRAKLTFVIVGGGPTGVEMAGAIREIAVEDIRKDFRNIDTGTTRIVLVQGEDRLLPAFAPPSSERARRDLENMGVEVRLKSLVTNIDEEGVWIGKEQLKAQNVIWAAGVEAPPVLKTMGVKADHSGRVIVGNDLTVEGYPQVFVLGDAAHVVDSTTGKPVPGLAPAAIQMGKYVAKIIRGEVSGCASPTDRPPFHYRDKGILATIGTRRAVADIHGLRFGGFLAWILWSVVHISFLIGFRNRLFVMAGWMYEYLAHTRGARLITGSFKLRISDPSVPGMTKPE
ncbi:MAG TPA: NAD(P)/FAD-dependent oxidoreductase [Tepidisphaeraceae bacterium]|nr:NAD(P)/FAD-dependent oxidoreductase [Tepidisphaeraceae bacterium]